MSITQLTAVAADLLGAQALVKGGAYERSPRRNRPSSRPPEDGGQSLVIREGFEDGLFVYTILDRATGQVMGHIPHEQAAQIAARADYAAGQVVNTKA